MHLELTVADAAARAEVYRLRHAVYASELGQYDLEPTGILPDAPGVESVYLTARIDGKLAGFVGITPPTSPRFSVDRHISRHASPVPFDRHLYEIRALTVQANWRGTFVSGGLMYAAFRWVQAHGGKRVVGMGRREILGMYLRCGLERAGRSFACGAVTYELIHGRIEAIAARMHGNRDLLDRMRPQLDWAFDFAFESPSECYHGGAFFDAIGERFDHLDRASAVINADVLDAWFPPAPQAQQALIEHLPWIMRTSPPTRAGGLVETIAEVRSVPPECILTGGGSSALIFLAFRTWLNPSSRVLVLDPTYGEYTHVLEEVVRCRVERFTLRRSEGYRVDPGRLAAKLAEGFDLLVWVNPNSPTGRHVPQDDVATVLHQASACRRIWIDETYVDYVGREQSLERFAARSENVIVCKSMSKVYALSGMRAAYLCASPHQLESLRPLTPPWSVGLPAQIAATAALHAEDYYQEVYRQTREFREELAAGLRALGIAEIVPGVANFLLCHLPEDWPSAAAVMRECRARGLYLRDVSNMGSALCSQAIRIAVKDAETNRRMLGILAEVLSPPLRARPTAVTEAMQQG